MRNYMYNLMNIYVSVTRLIMFSFYLLYDKNLFINDPGRVKLANSH